PPREKIGRKRLVANGRRRAAPPAPVVASPQACRNILLISNNYANVRAGIGGPRRRARHAFGEFRAKCGMADTPARARQGKKRGAVLAVGTKPARGPGPCGLRRLFVRRGRRIVWLMRAPIIVFFVA